MINVSVLNAGAFKYSDAIFEKWKLCLLYTDAYQSPWLSTLFEWISKIVLIELKIVSYRVTFKKEYSLLE